MHNQHTNRIKLAEAVRKACIKAAREQYHDASADGLCAEGALEAAIGAIEMVDVEQIISENASYESGEDNY